MLKLCRVTNVKVLFLLLVYVFNFNLFEFSAAILEKGLLKILISLVLSGKENEYKSEFERGVQLLGCKREQKPLSLPRPLIELST